LRTVDFEFVGFSDEDKKEKKKIGMYVIYRFRNGSRMSVLVNESDVDSLLIDLDSYVKIMMDKACFSHEEE
jgi:TRAP-type mannitol/chloroaromatic compound transport system substrate-binding protein